MNWMISMCVSLCLGSGLLLLEFYLSKKKAWQAGLIPILIVGLCACGLESYTEQQYRGYQIFTDAYPMTNGMTASMTIKQDAEQNKLVFSDLEIEDQDGTLRDADQILIQGETILSRYPSAASWYAKKYALQGDSMPVDFVKDENIFFGDTSISRHVQRIASGDHFTVERASDCRADFHRSEKKKSKNCAGNGLQ